MKIITGAEPTTEPEPEGAANAEPGMLILFLFVYFAMHFTKKKR